ncbi:MAG: DUF559 domain-containing protein [Planctomycetaceae bacterium]
MKMLRWPTESEQHKYMRMRKSQNIQKCRNSKAEAWMMEKLLRMCFTWTRQATWGYRLFDFWNHDLGCAVEVDGPEHDAGYDLYRDEYNFRRSGIMVLRVPNFSESDAKHALDLIDRLSNWSARRSHLGLDRRTKKARRELSSMIFNSSLLLAYIENVLSEELPWDDWREKQMAASSSMRQQTLF